LKHQGTSGKKACDVDHLLPVAREVFQVKSRVKKQLRNRKRRLEHRLRIRQWQQHKHRLFADQNIRAPRERLTALVDEPSVEVLPVGRAFQIRVHAGKRTGHRRLCQSASYHDPQFNQTSDERS
jgi:hypothetical protein